MIYKPFQNLSLSMLGMGNMRLPTVGERGPIDEAKAQEMLEYAFAHGVNYYDTAYRYHGGESERILGRVMKQFPRDQWYLATKMPGHMMQYRDGKLQLEGYLAKDVITSPAQIFEDQLEKCGVDYFDFYLLHNLCETSYDFYTNEELGLVDYLLEQKKAGRIRHLGFSAHGRADTIDRFLTAKKGCFEFVQLQINYLDWTLQEAGKKYEVVTRHGLPVISMESVRGGSLADLGPELNARLKQARPDDSIASWAFRWLQSLPAIQVVLSGMTTMEQLKENLSLFEAPIPTTPAENALLEDIVASMVDRVPCTACRYCTDDCPQGLDIPKLIAMYNETRFGPAFTLRFNMNSMKPEELPSACISCGACSKVCPQGIAIPEVMESFAKVLAKA